MVEVLSQNAPDTPAQASLFSPSLIPAEMLRKSSQHHFQGSSILKAFIEKDQTIRVIQPTSPTQQSEPTGSLLQGAGGAQSLPQQ